MKVLITGAGGFVGGHLLALLHADPSIELHGTILNETEKPRLNGLATPWELDLCNAEATRDLLASIQPDRIFHLAGQAYVPRSFEAPWETIETNIRGTLNVLQGVLDLKLMTRTLVIGSADVYGSATTSELPLTENSPFRPSSPYSVSKIGQDMLALQYTRAFKQFTVRTRPFNHIGPGQNQRFAVSDWAMQIATAEIEKRDGVVYVGDLSAARDFTDVRDVVQAYVLALEHGLPGEVFNVCSGIPHTMQSMLESLARLSTTKIEIKIDPTRFRPSEIPILYGDCSLLKTRTGWEPRIPIEQSLRDVLNECRQRANDNALAR